MSYSRFRGVSWKIDADKAGNVSNTHAVLCMLMDIRSQLIVLNGILGCPNFINLPNVLKDIKKNTTKPKKGKTK